MFIKENSRVCGGEGGGQALPAPAHDGHGTDGSTYGDHGNGRYGDGGARGRSGNNSNDNNNTNNVNHSNENNNNDNNHNSNDNNKMIIIIDGLLNQLQPKASNSHNIDSGAIKRGIKTVFTQH